MIANLDIREMVHDKGIAYKDIADKIGVSPEWLSRLMKIPLSPQNKDRILNAIEVLEKTDDVTLEKKQVFVVVTGLPYLKQLDSEIRKAIEKCGDVDIDIKYMRQR